MQEIIQKINQKLDKSGWYKELSSFTDSSYFEDILLALKKKVDEDKQRFCPAIGTAFRFLEDIEYNKVKAVILVDYIVNRIELNVGIPLGLPKNIIAGKITPWVLQSVDGVTLHYSQDWTKQGVLLIPLSLTTRVLGKDHKTIWKPFIIRIIEAVNRRHSEVPWFMIGSDTFKYYEDIASPYIRQAELRYPMQDKAWHIWINEQLKNKGKVPIVW